VPEDVLTYEDLCRAVVTLRESNVLPHGGQYLCHIHPVTWAFLLITYDVRLSYSDRCLAFERVRYEQRRSTRGAGWRSPYEWICERLAIVPAPGIIEAMGADVGVIELG